MAKDAKKTTAFGVSPERFSESRRHRETADTHTHTHTHKSVREPQAKELKQKRIQILTYGSLIARMDAYAKRQGVSRVDVFEAAVTAFLDSVEQ